MRKGSHHNDDAKRKLSESCKGKRVGKNNPFYGRHHTEKTRKLLAEKSKGNKSHFGCHHSEDVRRKISIAATGRKLSEEHKRKVGDANRGDRSARGMLGKHLSEEAKRKISEANRGRTHSEETRKRVSISKMGEKNPMYGKRGELHPMWKGGIAYLPYCNAFNKNVKELIREHFGRICFLCGIPENGRKLCIHHVDYNKGQGCGQQWCLVPLCQSCHAKTNYNRHYYFNLLANYWAVDWLDGIGT